MVWGDTQRTFPLFSEEAVPFSASLQLELAVMLVAR